MDASLGGSDPAQPVFPRLNVRDPFKRLGVSRDASEEEIREARNYLSSQYSSHEKSRESIEAAYDKIIMESFRDRRKSKINLKSNLKKKVEESPAWVRSMTNMVEVPSTTVVGQRAALFALLGVWSVFNPAEGGPAFQVAVSLAACVYFLNDRLKSIGRAFILGFGALVIGWVFGSFLVPVIPSQILPRSWTLELTTSLISYVFLWVACTFLK
jgi:curved DNA-binding protein CbpA